MPENIIKACVPIIAMVIIGVLCGLALYFGYDGVMLAAAVAVIAGLGGYSTKTALDAVREKKEE